MKKLLSLLLAAFWLSAILPVSANLIVYGTISGVVTETSGLVKTTVGDTVSGAFSYDYDLLSAPDASGHRMVFANDPDAYFFVVSSAGEGATGEDFSSGGGNLNLIVDASGLPYSGGAPGDPADLSIGPYFAAVVYGQEQNTGWIADVTYTITGVPDASATWILLFLGLAGVAVGRRFHRKLRV